MTAALRLCNFLLLLCLLYCGCSRQPTEQTGQADVATPTAHRSAARLSEPLTEQDVQTFLNVLEALPGGEPPQFEPLPQVTASKRLSAAKLVEVYRREFRATFDASRHGARWRQNADLMATFEKHNVTAEDFAALVIRMSCAVAAGAISPQVDLGQVADTADAEVTRLVEAINRIDATEQTPQVVTSRTQALNALQNSVAYSEFTRILQEVPPASRDLVVRHRSQLAGHLPSTGNLEQFGQPIESQIVPTGFEQPSPAR